MSRVLAALAVACTLSACGDPGTPPGGGTGGGTGSSCGASSCAGCCLAGACQAGSTASACGKGGGTCSVCQAHQVCRVDQTCGVDPNSSWNVQPSSATITATNNGTSWDADNSPPDPYVDLFCPAGASTITSTTPAVQDTLSPTWSTGGCIMKASDLLSSGFAFQVWDQDVLSDDPVCPRTTLSVNQSDFVGGELHPTAGALQAMIIKLVPQ